MAEQLNANNQRIWVQFQTSSTAISFSNRNVLFLKPYHAQKIETSSPEKVRTPEIPW